MKNILRKYREDNSGQALVVIAIAMVVLLGFAAFAVDLGYAAHQKSILQNAADSAALAGVMSVPSSTDDVVRAKVREYADANLKEPATIDNVGIDRSRNTVTVALSQETPRFFANIFSSETRVMAVRATAKAWAGEALPFINLDDNYVEGGTITLWDKLKSGDFERLLADISKDNTLCIVNYDGGVFFNEGVDASINKFVEYCNDQDKDVYVFSLRNNLIENPVDKINNKHLFPEEDLVLLRIRITGVDLNGKDRGIEARVIEVIPDFTEILPNVRASGESKAILIE